MNRALSVVLAAALTACSAAPESDYPESYRLVDAAVLAVDTMRHDPDQPGLNYHLENARGVLVFPDVLRGGLVWGGAGGKGLLLTRTTDGGWSAPAFYTIGGMSWGLQAGAETVRAMVVLMNDEAVQKVLEGGLTLGTSIGIAAGDRSAGARANTTTTPVDSYFYLASSGAYAGATLTGAVLDEDRELNRGFYDRFATASQICLDRTVSHSRAAPLQGALSR